MSFSFFLLVCYQLLQSRLFVAWTEHSPSSPCPANSRFALSTRSLQRIVFRHWLFDLLSLRIDPLVRGHKESVQTKNSFHLRSPGPQVRSWGSFLSHGHKMDTIIFRWFTSRKSSLWFLVPIQNWSNTSEGKKAGLFEKRQKLQRLGKRDTRIVSPKIRPSCEHSHMRYVA